MAAKSKVGLFWAQCCALTIVNLTSCVLNTFPPPPLSPSFSPFIADFLLFSFQPHTNGWRVSVPFKRSTPSKGGAKADGQVSSFSGARPHLRSWVYIWKLCRYQISQENHSNSPLSVFSSGQCVQVGDGCKVIASQRHKGGRRCKVKERQTKICDRGAKGNTKITLRETL